MRRNETEIHLISKDALKCLYEETDGLLSEPADPVIVLLKSQCSQPIQELASEEKGQLPIPKLNPKIGSDATLNHEDVLVLTHLQLKCFKLAFDNIMLQTEDLVRVHFIESCNMTDKIKP
jgi:hypothetical protein